MKKLIMSLGCAAVAALTFNACQDDLGTNPTIPSNVIDQLTQMGFNPDGIEIHEDGYLIERDIIITQDFLDSHGEENRVPSLEQYSTNNLVNPGNYPGGVIKIYMSAADNPAGTSINKMRGGKPGGGGGGGADFDASYGRALNDAIGRYNSENLAISFERVFTSGEADIQFRRLRKGDERQGILGSAGFPTSSGNAYGTVNMSGIIISRYGWSEAAVATVMAHELGHCIGFRHTDYFDRSISCGSGGNEGDGGVGANHIPGTPTDATLAKKSFMLSCTGGGDRPFNNDDKTALNYLY